MPASCNRCRVPRSPRSTRSRIGFVGDAGLGTFLPREAAELARSRLEILSGFGFLHFRNRTFEYYQTGIAPHPVLRSALLPDFALLQGRLRPPLCRRLRTAAWRRRRCSGGIDPAPDRRLPVDQQTFAAALYDYESACEALVDVNVELEIENVYSPSRQRGAGAGYQLLDIAADVVSLFPNGNIREGMSLESGRRPTCSICPRRERW